MFIGPPTLSIYPWTAVADVESLTFTPSPNFNIDDAWVVVWIPTCNFLGKVFIEFLFSLSILPDLVSISEL